jgi:hypothetical protein
MTDTVLQAGRDSTKKKWDQRQIFLYF